ncbi:MAG: hypothetical protein BRD45_01950 [Bacteroidetes bacterium QS_8_64_10]|nr:MAG: hypothetical protein BRD45_01950 [Bacteroidetes bacterium QS_8_64_10]
MLFGVGCERPFVEHAPATFELVQPDSLDQAFTRRTLPVEINVSAQRDVRGVRLNGEEMSRSERRRDVWTDTVALNVGVNELQLATYDGEGVIGRDTLYTAAAGDAFLLPDDQVRAERVEASLVAPRVGHTATRLPDGRVLLLGGSRAAKPTSASDLVRAVEVYDPVSQDFQRLPVSGRAAPRRTRHGAFLMTRAPNPVIGVYGGYGGTGEPLSPRGDLRRFMLRRDTLVALDPALGLTLPGDLGEAIDGHTITPLAGPQFLVAGSYFVSEGARDVTFRLNASSLNDRSTLPAPRFRTPRTRHAAAPVTGNPAVLFFGGRLGNTASTALNDVELHAPREGETFGVRGGLPSSVFSLTATKRAPSRILLLGGFSVTGEGRTDGVFFDITG